LTSLRVGLVSWSHSRSRSSTEKYIGCLRVQERLELLRFHTEVVTHHDALRHQKERVLKTNLICSKNLAINRHKTIPAGVHVDFVGIRAVHEPCRTELLWISLAGFVHIRQTASEVHTRTGESEVIDARCGFRVIHMYGEWSKSHGNILAKRIVRFPSVDHFPKPPDQDQELGLPGWQPMICNRGV
jgi:hypothetical protein